MRQMFSCLSILIVFLSSALAQQNPINSDINPATGVTMHVQAEMWATSRSATVTTRINAVLNNSGLEQIYKEVLQKLGVLANSNWHIVTFNRSQDKSGLEQVEIYAETRLPITDLAGIRDRASKISHPGETFTIDDINFHPSSEDIEATRSLLRMKIYNISKIELANLNKTYPDKNFTVRKVNFVLGFPDDSLLSNAKTNGRLVTLIAPQTNIQTSDKVKMSAILEFISMGKE